MLSVGYGYLDEEEIIINGNLNKLPQPHITRSEKMIINEKILISSDEK